MKFHWFHSEICNYLMQIIKQITKSEWALESMLAFTALVRTIYILVKNVTNVSCQVGVTLGELGW
jgi:hypothetical protein